MNPGGIRQDLICTPPCTLGPANVTYNQLFTVQPFDNVMTVKTMTGDMIYRLLAQQFVVAPAPNFRILQVSDGFTYSGRRTRPRMSSTGRWRSTESRWTRPRATASR
jgi:5'-nucleotidase